VQYASPQFRQMAQHPQLDIQVAYCSLQGAEPGFDPDMERQVAWDVPLLEGYPWISVPNRSLRPGIQRFWGLVNPGLWKIVRDGRFDVIVSFAGYSYASFWILAASAKLRGIPFLFGTDATSLDARDGKHWKVKLKQLVLPVIFRLASVVIAPSAAGKQFIRSLGIKESKIVLMPFVIDNEWWVRQASQIDRKAARRRWGIPEQATVVLFCAKLQPWKRPQDVLQAFARARVPGSVLVFAGEGQLRGQLEVDSLSLGIKEKVKFLGFVDQSELPSVYCAADLFVIPSKYDPCPVVVCEAMVCGCPVILSDEIRGRFELVQPGQTGFIFPCGDVEKLAEILSEVLPDRGALKKMSEAARERMRTWSLRENIAGVMEAVQKVSSK
jgi:glycosyltransferase involved in cell wall biosynthesis